MGCLLNDIIFENIVQILLFLSLLIKFDCTNVFSVLYS